MAKSVTVARHQFSMNVVNFSHHNDSIFDITATCLNLISQHGIQNCSAKYSIWQLVSSISAGQALCLNEKQDFDKKLLKPWLKPLKIEVDFEQRAKIRKIEEKDNSDVTSGEPSPKKSKGIFA